MAQILADKGMRQFHTAETEKYAHVTYFFNGGREQPFEGEDRELVPSAKVATYDQKPEMSAAGVANRTRYPRSIALSPRPTSQVRLVDAGRNSHILLSFSGPSSFTMRGIPSSASL